MAEVRFGEIPSEYWLSAKHLDSIGMRYLVKRLRKAREEKVKV